MSALQLLSPGLKMTEKRYSKNPAGERARKVPLPHGFFDALGHVVPEVCQGHGGAAAPRAVGEKKRFPLLSKKQKGIIIVI